MCKRFEISENDSERVDYHLNVKHKMIAAEHNLPVAKTTAELGLNFELVHGSPRNKQEKKCNADSEVDAELITPMCY
jgi:hypothetical protein